MYNEMIQVMMEGGLADVAVQLKDGPLVISATPNTMTPTIVDCEFLRAYFPSTFDIFTINVLYKYINQYYGVCTSLIQHTMR